jgi:hypothetical protein
MSKSVVCGTRDFKSPDNVDRQTDVVRRVVSIRFANVHKKCSARGPGAGGTAQPLTH